jgi:hypothetical protein
MKKLTTIIAALAISTLFAAGTAQAQAHHSGGNGNGNRGVIVNHPGNFNHGGDFHGGEINRGGGRDYGRDYRGGRDFGRDYRGGRGGIDINIGGGRGYYPYGRGWNGGYYNNYPATQIVYEQVQERVYDEYQGGWVFTGRIISVSHVARWDNSYRGYVWYDSNGELRVN